MSETTITLRRKLDSAADLQSVVRTMKALAASSIGQYEKSVHALGDYYRTVELGLGVCLRAEGASLAPSGPSASASGTSVCVVVFGSDQGLVGQFNEVALESAMAALAVLPGSPQVWTVGDRIHARLVDAGVPVAGRFSLPSSATAIGPFVSQLLVEAETHTQPSGLGELHVFYNRPVAGSTYEPANRRVLPLDAEWARNLAGAPWPGIPRAEVLGNNTATLRALIGEYVFISLFQACAESLASENSARLAAMQRADKNIDDLIENLSGQFHSLRQSDIDEELFDVISGVEALSE
jgi:F-type H+-transporting ATPase subunit gamma